MVLDGLSFGGAERARRDRHYDPTLARELPSTNGGHPVVLNGAFAQWEELIVQDLRYRGGDYERSDARSLVERCQEHAAQHARPIGAPNLVCLVHPFYLQLTQMHLLTVRQRGDALRYRKTLFDFLATPLDRDQADVVLFETAFHYAAASSLLLENGTAARVILTQYDNGIPLDPADIRGLRAESYAVGGGYVNRCLEHVLRSINNVCDVTPQVIGDLVLHSPYDRPSLVPTVVSFAESDYAVIEIVPSTTTTRELRRRFTRSGSTGSPRNGTAPRASCRNS